MKASTNLGQQSQQHQLGQQWDSVPPAAATARQKEQAPAAKWREVDSFFSKEMPRVVHQAQIAPLAQPNPLAKTGALPLPAALHREHAAPLQQPLVQARQTARAEPLTDRAINKNTTATVRSRRAGINAETAKVIARRRSLQGEATKVSAIHLATAAKADSFSRMVAFIALAVGIVSTLMAALSLAEMFPLLSLLLLVATGIGMVTLLVVCDLPVSLAPTYMYTMPYMIPEYPAPLIVWPGRKFRRR